MDVTWDTFLALSLTSLWMRAPNRAGWQWDLQECLLVAVLQETHFFSLQSTSPGWVFLTVQAKCTCYHSGLAAGPSCASFPGSHSSRVHAEKWKIQNSSLGHNFTFFFFLFSFFPPLLGAAQPLWRLVHAWPCILLLGMLKIPATIFPFHIPKYINVLLL